jgi:hypothetical protein
VAYTEYEGKNPHTGVCVYVEIVYGVVGSKMFFMTVPEISGVVLILVKEQG